MILKIHINGIISQFSSDVYLSEMKNDVVLYCPWDIYSCEIRTMFVKAATRIKNMDMIFIQNNMVHRNNLIHGSP